MSVAWVGAGIAGVGVLSSMDASGDAVDAQLAGAREANSTQLKMFNQSRDDQEPWRQIGQAGLNELALRLGIFPSSAGANAFQEKTEAQIRQELLPEFQTGGQVVPIYRHELGTNDGPTIEGYEFAQGALDEAALAKAVQQRLQQQAQDKAAFEAKNAATQSDPKFGSLLKNFTATDFEKDPGYDFRLSEGMKGITNSAAARGGLLSGEALKAAGRYNQNFASNEFGNAYNRFNNNQTNQFNRLASLAGVGQQAATQIGQQGIATGNQIAQNQIGAGNARASGYIGQSNALTGGLAQGFNWWQQNQAMNNSGNSMAGYNGAYSNLDFDVGNMS